MPSQRPPASFPPPVGTVPRRGIEWRRLLSDYGPPALLMALIFFASTDAGSTAQTGRLIGRILSLLGLRERLSPEALEALHYAIRKAGHVAEYALLAGLLHRAMARGRRRWALPVVAGVMAATTGYAATDELHQRFVAGRGGSGWDVLLDSVGAALGLGVKWVLEGGWRTANGDNG